MNIEYTKVGDYLLPNLIIKNQNYEQINKYGYLRLNYIKEHKKALYTTILMKNELTNHLLSVSKECENKYNILMNNYIKNDEKLSEKNKENNQFEWVQLMNNYNYLESYSNKDYDFKNEKTEYVSCINCSEYNPYSDMKFTKELYRKTDGILAFHGYQSFKEGEVAADIAHEIGVKFAEEMFKDYEVIVATHQNTNHIHNHFIINSVSYKTGKKYNNNRANLAKLRQISDSICAEYGLSVLDEDISYKNTYKHKVLNDDYYKILKEDLDNVISYSVSLKQVVERLKKLDYQVYILVMVY